VGGYPVPVKGKLTKISDRWVTDANACRRSVVLFDEFTVSPDHQAAALRVFSERMAGETRLGGHVRLAAMANPPSCAATPHELTPPAANRFGHLRWEGFSAEEFGEWLISGAGNFEDAPIDADALEARVLAAWPAAMARACALVRGYLKCFPADLHEMPRVQTSSDDEVERLRWASRRTWELVTRALAASDAHGLSVAETHAFVAAFLPGPLAAKFAGYCSQSDLASPTDYLDGVVTFEPNDRMDRTFAVLDMTASFLLTSPSDEKLLARAKMWWQIAKTVTEHKFGGKDFVVPGARLLVRDRSQGGADLGPSRIPEASEVVESLASVLVAAKNVRINGGRT
jgi:hypothetical protein